MNEQDVSEQQVAQMLDTEEAIPLPSYIPHPIPLPLFPPVSGLYEWRLQLYPLPVPLPLPERPIPTKPIPDLPPRPVPSSTPAAELGTLLPWWFSREELRLDVDRRYPQNVASGTVFRFLRTRVHWIANLSRVNLNTWTGNIWYKDGDVASFPFTNVRIQVVRSWYPAQRKATVTFSGGGAVEHTRTFKFKSIYFHPVEFEFDCAEGTTAVTSVQTHDHPNRPDTMPSETLSIETVYKRSGFKVRKSEGDIVPLSLAGADARWSDMEMHDAMQTYWSRFADRAQWSMWVFFASLHERGTSLGGIMFDDIGPNHRQGTSIFNDAFISNAPAGDAAPAAWVRRMRFWTAVHEMGHAFNLAHSWQKALVYDGKGPWIPLANEPEARSFMNYPYNVTGGQAAFFADFEYRFSDGELLFLRHAPARFVQMGNAEWFDHHGFQQANVSLEPDFRLELRANRAKTEFEFMEPVVLELKLTNISSQDQIIDANILSAVDHMAVVIKKSGKPARLFSPYAQYCFESKNKIVKTGESEYESLFISAGQNGWDLAEPGNYTIQVCLHIGAEDLVSNPLHLRVAPPRGYDEEWLAQDFFSDDVGRILTFDGSKFLNKGNDTLHEIIEKLSDHKVARHARVALANPMTRKYKQLDLGESKRPVMPVYMAGGKIKVSPPNVAEARKELAAALTEKTDAAAESLGHIDYKHYVDQFCDWLDKQGVSDEAIQIQDGLYKTLSARKVLNRVLQDIKNRRDSYKHEA